MPSKSFEKIDIGEEIFENESDSSRELNNCKPIDEYAEINVEYKHSLKTEILEPNGIEDDNIEVYVANYFNQHEESSTLDYYSMLDCIADTKSKSEEPSLPKSEYYLQLDDIKPKVAAEKKTWSRIVYDKSQAEKSCFNKAEKKKYFNRKNKGIKDENVSMVF